MLKVLMNKFVNSYENECYCMLTSEWISCQRLLRFNCIFTFLHELFRLQQCIRSCLITELHISNLQTQLISLCEHATLSLTWITFYQENISSHKKLIGPTIDTQLESCTWCKNRIRANLRMITISWYFHRSLDLYHLDFSSFVA